MCHLGWTNNISVIEITNNFQAKCNLFHATSLFLYPLKTQKQSPGAALKISVLKDFAKFKVKHQYHSLFFNKVAVLRPTTLLKRDPENTVFNRTLPVAASSNRKLQVTASIPLEGCLTLKTRVLNNGTLVVSQKAVQQFAVLLLVFRLFLFGIYLFKVNIGNPRTICEICLKLTINKDTRTTSLTSFWCLYY